MPDTDISYHETGGPGSHDFEVRREGHVLGRVRRFTMGAGQFGATWIATTASGEQRTGLPTREAAAEWLLGRVSEAD